MKSQKSQTANKFFSLFWIFFMIVTDKMREVAEASKHWDIAKVASQFSLPAETITRYIRAVKEIRHNAKILVFDIETQANVGYFWQPYKTSIFLAQMIRPWYVISWSAKWLHDNEVMSDVLKPAEAKKQNDKRICTSLWKLFDEADVLIAHYGDKFDIPKMNTRFLLQGLGIPSPYQSIDTKHAASKRFAFTYNKLDALGEALGIGQKIETDFKLWKDCDNGDAGALDLISEYNDQDVLLLEEIYLALRPWIPSHPNMNNYSDTDVCNICGSSELTPKGHYATLVNKYTTYVCGHCGGFTKRVRKNLSGLAR